MSKGQQNRGAKKKARWTRSQKMAAKKRSARQDRMSRRGEDWMPRHERGAAAAADRRRKDRPEHSDRRSGSFREEQSEYGSRRPRGHARGPQRGPRKPWEERSGGRRDGSRGGRWDDRRDDRRGGGRWDDRRDERRDDRRGGGRWEDRRDDRRGGGRWDDRRDERQGSGRGGYRQDRRDDRRDSGRWDDRRGGGRWDDRRDDRRGGGRSGYRDNRKGGHTRPEHREHHRQEEIVSHATESQELPVLLEDNAPKELENPPATTAETLPATEKKTTETSEDLRPVTPEETGDNSDSTADNPSETPASSEENNSAETAELAGITDSEMPTVKFSEMGLPTEIVERLAREGIVEAFPIQAAAIPDALAGRDVLGRGRTGSGKTFAFGLPLLTRLNDGKKPHPNKPRSIVLVPTRELAIQVADELMPLVHVLGMNHKVVAGGMPYPPQLQALEQGLDLLVATPGRLIDLMQRGAADLSEVEIAVLDEADYMAEIGFLEAVVEIMDTVPAGGQRLLFSATLDRGIDTVVDKYLQDPVTHSTDTGQASVTTMAHYPFHIDPHNKKSITAQLANRKGRTLVFARTKLGADRVARELRERGVLAAALHGGLNQSQRNRTLRAFKTGDLPVIVATDVAARGIHVDDVGVVVQADPPADHKDYLHRAGRTARAGEQGQVITLVLPHQRRMMRRLLEAAGVEIDLIRVQPGDEIILDAGGSEPTGEAYNEEDLRRITMPPRRGRGRHGHREGGRGRHGRRHGRGPGNSRGRGGRRERQREDRDHNGGFREERQDRRHSHKDGWDDRRGPKRRHRHDDIDGGFHRRAQAQHRERRQGR